MTNNFITYCDSMVIATEGAKENIQKMKAWLIKQFNRILDWLAKMAKKMKPSSKLRSKLLKMVAKAKSGLSKSKALNEQNPELIEKLKGEVTELQEESVTLHEQLERELEEVDKMYNEVERDLDAKHNLDKEIMTLSESNLEEVRDLYKKRGDTKAAQEIDKIINTRSMRHRTIMIDHFNISREADHILNKMENTAKKSAAYADVAHRFATSGENAEKQGVPKSKILKSKKDIDDYFIK